MKKYFRFLAGFLIVFPFMVTTKFLSLFIGNEKAVKLIGPYTTKTAKKMLRYWVPSIERPEDFDKFSIKMKKKFWLWKPFYDIEIIHDNSDVFQLHITNCPFCEVLNNFGFEKLSKYVCEGDWEIAKENSDKWLFERSHQIGSGDEYCNHTYKRTKS